MRHFLIILLMILPSLALAQTKTDGKQPVEINADALEVLQQDKKAIFKGNVIARQGDITMKSATMTVFYKGGMTDETTQDNGISRLLAGGGVTFVSPNETASGSQADYDVNSKVIVMTGNVVLTRDKNILKGSRLEYNINTGRSVLNGGVSGSAENGGAKSGGRVRALFVPDEGK